jgi:hypothetical protein
MSKNSPKWNYNKYSKAWVARANKRKWVLTRIPITSDDNMPTDTWYLYLCTEEATLLIRWDCKGKTPVTGDQPPFEWASDLLKNKS